MPHAAPIPYSPELEAERTFDTEPVRAMKSEFTEIMKTTARDYGHAVRSVHAKAHGIVKGRLEVLPDLPPEYAQGLFASSDTHDVHIRLSTNAGDILDDAIALPRGLALKVHGVPGERLPDAQGDTQDFLFLNAPAFPAPDAEAFEHNLRLLAKTTDRVEWLKRIAAHAAHGANAARELVGLDPAPSLALMGGMPNVQPLGEDYYSTVPFRHGDYVAKYSLVPAARWMAELAGEAIDVDGRENAVREEVTDQLAEREARWDFRVQLLRDAQAQPIEDASVVWPEEISPWYTVGTVIVPPQNGWHTGLVKEVNDHFRFSPWTGLAAHRPLGDVNRARKQTYEHSAEFRSRANGCPIHEGAALAG